MTAIDQEKLIKLVVAELAKQRPNHKPAAKRMLAIFSAGTIGLDVVLQQMQQLQQQGCQFEAVLTPNGKRVIGTPKLKSALGPNSVYDDCEDFTQLIALLDDCDAVLIPVMTINTAAKIVNGIADNLATTLIMSALLAGKPVIGVRDACDLKNVSRVGMGHNKAARAYQAMLLSNVERLNDYGLALCESQDLAKTVQLSLGDKATVHPEAKEGRQVFNKQILSVADLPISGVQITVSPRTIITPAAKDAIKERGIEVIIC